MFDRFSYIEKAEYWALIWGTFVMAATGFIMWFDNTFIGLLTKLGYDVARTIHYYEAWLATLAIVVWHFYFVIFNPDSYPLNLAFWKGTLTEEEMAEEHPVEELSVIPSQEGLGQAWSPVHCHLQARQGEDGSGQERRVDRARFAHRQRAHRDSRRHLHHGQERVEPVQGSALHRHSQHG